MKKQRITQDYIAKQLNVSRNTVSKVFNNQPGVSEETRKMVVSVANELNYQTNVFNPNGDGFTNKPLFTDIAFVCHSDSLTSSFWMPIVQSTEAVLNEKNINFRLVIIRKFDEDNCITPNSLVVNPPDGIIMIGRFSGDYYKAMFGLHCPTVTLDIAKDVDLKESNTDVIMMEDFNSTYTLTNRIINDGHTNIAFVGDKTWCNSFYLRWCGYSAAMLDNNLPIPNLYDIYIFNEERISEISETLYTAISNADIIPTAFVCANDILAAAIDALQYPPYSLFDTIRISGFDNNKSIRITSPNFSTVDPDLKEIGKVLAEQIIYKINNPKRKSRIIHVTSNLVFNE